MPPCMAAFALKVVSGRITRYPDTDPNADARKGA
jgi:hypothetical protein